MEACHLSRVPEDVNKTRSESFFHFAFPSI